MGHARHGAPDCRHARRLFLFFSKPSNLPEVLDKDHAPYLLLVFVDKGAGESHRNLFACLVQDFSFHVNDLSGRTILIAVKSVPDSGSPFL